MERHLSSCQSGKWNFFFFFASIFFFFFDIIADRDDSRGKEEKTSVGAEGTVTRGSKGITLDVVRYRYIFDQILVWFVLVEENLLQ